MQNKSKPSKDKKIKKAKKHQGVQKFSKNCTYFIIQSPLQETHLKMSRKKKL